MPHPPAQPTTEDRDDDETLLYASIGGIGMLRVAVTVACGQAFGTEATLALFMVAAGAGGLAANAWKRRS